MADLARDGAAAVPTVPGVVTTPAAGRPRLAGLLLYRNRYFLCHKEK